MTKPYVIPNVRTFASRCRMVAKASAILSWFWFIGTGTNAQSTGQSPPTNGFADKSFYLIDSLILSELAQSDRILIDSTLKQYHEASHDTMQLNYLIHIVNECQDGGVWPKYNQLMYMKVQEKLSSDLSMGKTGQSLILDQKYLSTLAEALSNLGYFYDDQGNMLEALKHYDKSLNIYKGLGDTLGIAGCLSSLAIIYIGRGDIPRALLNLHESLKIYEEMGDKSGLALTLNNIGFIYNHQGDISQALEYYQRSLTAEEEIGNEEGKATSLNNIGAIYDNAGDFPKALKYYYSGLRIYEETSDKGGIATALNNIGRVYDQQGDTSKALEYLHKSLKMYEQAGNKQGIASALNNIGSIELGQASIGSKAHKQEALVRASKKGNRGLLIAREIGSPRLISDNSDLLSKVAKEQAALTTRPTLRQAKYKEALEMYELHILMRDSIKNEETQKATIRQQTKYEFEKAQLIRQQEEKEQARLEAEVTGRRDNLQYSIVLICLLAIGVLVAMLGRLSLPMKLAEGIIFFSFLILFEFLLVLADPYIEGWSEGAPGTKLLFNAGVAALIFPLHSLFEEKLKGRLVKTKKADKSLIL